ncbi:MAG: hypothetical protein ABIH20_05555 [Candidatus Diapherotrites archaeon]
MAKTLRVEDSTYAMVMDLVGRIQMRKKKRVTVDVALREVVSKETTKKDPDAWNKFEKLSFSGPKTNSVEDIDLLQ